MNTNVVLRDVPSSQELVDFARRCCTELAQHLWPRERCDVLLQAIRPGGDVIACVVIGEDEPMAVQCSDPDPFTAVSKAVADMLSYLESERGGAESPYGDVAKATDLPLAQRIRVTG